MRLQHRITLWIRLRESSRSTVLRTRLRRNNTNLGRAPVHGFHRREDVSGGDAPRDVRATEAGVQDAFLQLSDLATQLQHVVVFFLFLVVHWCRYCGAAGYVIVARRSAFGLCLDLVGPAIRTQKVELIQQAALVKKDGGLGWRIGGLFLVLVVLSLFFSELEEALAVWLQRAVTAKLLELGGFPRDPGLALVLAQEAEHAQEPLLALGR